MPEQEYHRPSKSKQKPWSPAPLHLDLSDCQFKLKTIRTGQHLCYQGQSSQKLYILHSGLLKSYVTKINGQEFVMGFYLPSDLFGWEGIHKPRHAISIIALSESIVKVIQAEKILALTQENPKLGYRLLCQISQRIHHDNIALLRTTAQQRVATFLLQLTARYRELGYAHNRCQLLMPHQDIANYLRINPSTISRIFNSLQKKQLITLERNTVHLHDIPQLRMVAEMEVK